MKTPFESIRLIIAVGTEETDEFKDQSRSFYENWKNKNESVELLEVQGLNHFSILDSISDASSALHQSVCRMMGTG